MLKSSIFQNNGIRVSVPTYDNLDLRGSRRENARVKLVWNTVIQSNITHITLATLKNKFMQFQQNCLYLVVPSDAWFLFVQVLRFATPCLVEEINYKIKNLFF